MANELAPLTVDLSDVASFDPVPNDLYKVAIVQAKNQRPGKKDPSGVTWDLLVQIMHNTSGDETFAKRKVFTSLYWSPTVQDFMGDFLNSIGEPFEPGPEVHIDPRGWPGKFATVEIVQEPRKDKQGNIIPNKMQSVIKKWIPEN